MTPTSAVATVRRLGWKAVLAKVAARAHTPPLTMYDDLVSALTDARALEIGGPSEVFREAVPAYRCCRSIDNVNFSSQTLWERDLEHDGPYAPDGVTTGIQMVGEAGSIATEKPYDAVLSSHMIEHTANPLGVLRSWRSLTVPGGHLVLVLPHRDATFDHRRPITTLAHLEQDAHAEMPESDQTHFPEIIELHDISLDRGVTSSAHLEARLADNMENRGAHHHVFSSTSAARMVHAAGWSPLAVEVRLPMDIVVLARNRPATTLDLGVIRRSPFRSDR